MTAKNKMVSVASHTLAKMGEGDIYEIEKHIESIKTQINNGDLTGVVNILTDQMLMLHGIGIRYLKEGINQPKASVAAKYMNLAMRAFDMADKSARTLLIITGSDHSVFKKVKGLIESEVSKRLGYVDNKDSEQQTEE